MTRPRLALIGLVLAAIAQIGPESDQEMRGGLIDDAAKIVQDGVAAIPLHQQAIV